jgi:hypothetical protein
MREDGGGGDYWEGLRLAGERYKFSAMKVPRHFSLVLLVKAVVLNSIYKYSSYLKKRLHDETEDKIWLIDVLTHKTETEV